VQRAAIEFDFSQVAPCPCAVLPWPRGRQLTRPAGMPHRLASRRMAWHGIGSGGRASHSGEEAREGVTQITQPNSEPRPSTDAAQRSLSCTCTGGNVYLCRCRAFALPMLCLCCTFAVPLLYNTIHPPTAIFRTLGRRKTPACLLYAFTSCFIKSGCIRPPRPPTTADNTQPQHNPAQAHFCHYLPYSCVR
jgi:hypothetical protein